MEFVFKKSHRARMTIFPKAQINGLIMISMGASYMISGSETKITLGRVIVGEVRHCDSNVAHHIRKAQN